MDNQTPKRLNEKCEIFNRLYHGKQNDFGCRRLPVETCHNFKISDQYMCPQLPPGGHREEHAPRCHQDGRQLGRHLCSEPPQSNNKPSTEAGFLPDRLSAQGSYLMNELKKLQKNPDFQRSTEMVMSGGKGLANYFINNLPQIVEQAGGGPECGNLVNNLRSSAINLGSLADELVNQCTVGDAVENFVNYCHSGSVPPRLERSVKRHLNNLKDDAVIYCYLLNGLLSRVTVNDVIENCLRGYLSVNKQLEHIGGALKAVQSGGSPQDQVFHLFDILKETIGTLTGSFKKQLRRTGAPLSVINNVTEIENGLTLALQIFQYQIVNGQTPTLPVNTAQASTARANTPVTPQQIPMQNAYARQPPFQPVISESGSPTAYSMGGASHHSGGCRACGCEYSDCKCQHSIPSRTQGHCGLYPLDYLLPADGNITPSVYLDPCQDSIAKHPVRSRRIHEFQLPIPAGCCRRHNLKKCLSCTQPNWHADCL